MEPAEIIDVDSETVACDGGEGALGHPRVFLNMKGQGQIDCPYCGIRFVLKADATDAADATAVAVAKGRPTARSTVTTSSRMPRSARRAIT